MLFNILKSNDNKSLVNNIDPTYPVSPKNISDDSLVAPGFMGVFGNGLYSVYDQQGTFSYIVPENVSKIRVRVLGRGSQGDYYHGGSGGGYAHGVFDVTPNEQFTLKIPDLRANGISNTEFGNTSRGILIYATKGTAGGTTIGIGGKGYGGDYQSTGGVSIYTGFERNIAGAASGNQIAKVGGKVIETGVLGGGGAKGKSGYTGTNKAGGAVGDATNSQHGAGISLTGLLLPPGFPRFPLDGLYGAGATGLPGAGGNDQVLPGICGGEGGKSTTAVIYGGGLHNLNWNNANMTTRGLIVVEW